MAFLLSNRGKRKLSENGYVYVKNKKSADGEEAFWNCEKHMLDKRKLVKPLFTIKLETRP